MAAATNGTHALPPVTRVLILGYYDGATDGVLQCGDGGPVYRFDLADEAHNPKGCDTRTFDLRPLPPAALDRLAAAIAADQTPSWPVWAPAWTFPTDDARERADRAVDAVLAEAGPVTWTLTTADTARFASFAAAPVAAAAGAR